MKALAFSGVLFIVVAGLVLVVAGGAGRARRAGILTGACAVEKSLDSALERECERARECE